MALPHTPPFPDYTAGSAIFGAEVGEILALFFGTDNISFSIPSKNYQGFLTRTTVLTEFMEENAISRVYGGIHVRSSSLNGMQVGRTVAQFVFKSILGPV